MTPYHFKKLMYENSFYTHCSSEVAILREMKASCLSHASKKKGKGRWDLAWRWRSEVDAHDGTIEVGSEMGKGAVFTVSYRSVHNYFYEFYIFMTGGPKLWMPPYYSTFFSASVQG